jgi:hypothetical protein
VLILDMREVLSPLGKYKYDTCRILLVKCYIDNSVRLRNCIQNINKYSGVITGEEDSIFYLSIDCIG